MKRFENCILTFPMQKKTALADMQAKLNDLGLDGWEVVSVVGSEYANIGFTAFLKREIADDLTGERAA